MALAAIAAGSKGIFAVMTDSAGTAFVHIFHGSLTYDGTVWENLCVAIGALVNLEME